MSRRVRSVSLLLAIGLGLVCFSPVPRSVHAEETVTCDVCVYGGTPAGLSAAIAAARKGGNVVVIEPTRWIGGVVTGGLSRTDKGREETIGGIAREYFRRAAEAVPGTPMWYAEPHINMQTFKTVLDEAGVPVVTESRLQSVNMQGKRIASVTTTRGKTYRAAVFIDASYEGDLLDAAGVSSIIGRESRKTYGEPLAGFHPMPIRERSAEVMASVCPCIGGDGPHFIHGTPCRISALDENGDLLPGVARGESEAGEADGLTQAYNFRLCVTQKSENRVPFRKPENYDPHKYELLLRLIESYPRVRFGRLVHLGQIANDKYDLNAQGLFSTDYAGGNVDYPDGDAVTRARIRQDHVDYVQGFLWFLGHDHRVPQELRDEVNSWGLCQDEFVDNDHWPYALYVRDARRMIGDYVMTQRDTQSDITKPDSVAMGSFVIDCHIVQRIVTDEGMVTDEGSFADAPARPYQIPYRSLTPRAEQCENLLVPVCLSASHVAMCTIRMEPVYMALGHASGVAAMMAARKQQAVQSVDISALQQTLRDDGQVLSLPGVADGPTTEKIGGLVQDDLQAALTGTWKSSPYGNPINGFSQHDENFDKAGKSARFVVPVPQSGQYEVRLSYVSAPNRASNVPVTVKHAGGTAETTVNERQRPAIDGLFVSLGTWQFAKDEPAVITLRCRGTDGYVSIDAVQLVPVE